MRREAHCHRDRQLCPENDVGRERGMSMTSMREKRNGMVENSRSTRSSLEKMRENDKMLEELGLKEHGLLVSTQQIRTQPADQPSFPLPCIFS